MPRSRTVGGDGVATAGRQALRKLYSPWIRWRRARQRRDISRILSRRDEPQVYDSDELFGALQGECQPCKEYGYDDYSTWRRGMERAVRVLCPSDLHVCGLEVLEAGCGDGMTGFAIATYGHRVTLVDLEDWRDARARQLPLIRGDLCSRLSLAPDSFDLIVSFNTFEHVADPQAAFLELVRVCRPGGHVYLDFGPLYASALGLHAHRTIFVPYPQFLFSEGFIVAKLKELGLTDLGRKRENLQPLNRWRVRQFAGLWSAVGCALVSHVVEVDLAHLTYVKRFSGAFQGRGLTFEDVTTQGIRVILKKTGT